MRMMRGSGIVGLFLMMMMVVMMMMMMMYD